MYRKWSSFEHMRSWEWVIFWGCGPEACSSQMHDHLMIFHVNKTACFHSVLLSLIDTSQSNFVQVILCGFRLHILEASVALRSVQVKYDKNAILLKRRLKWYPLGRLWFNVSLCLFDFLYLNWGNFDFKSWANFVTRRDWAGAGWKQGTRSWEVYFGHACCAMASMRMGLQAGRVHFRGWLCGDASC